MSEELDGLYAQLDIARRTHDGALNLLQVFEEDEDESKRQLRGQVATELEAAGQRIAELQAAIDVVQARLGTGAGDETSDSTAPRLRFQDQVAEDEEETRQTATELLRDLSGQPEAEAMSRMTTLTGIMQQSTTMSQLPIELAASCLLPLLSDESTVGLRASTYRLLRHFMPSEHAVDELRNRHLDIYLIRTLSRDARFDLEKQQAIRTVRHVLQFPGRISPAVLKAIVAVAENGEDKLRLVCLELLAELVICDIDLLTRADGLRVVLQALADGPYEIAPTLASLFLYLVDTPRLRAYLRPGTDIEMALDGLSEAPGKGHFFTEKTKSSVRIITMLLKSWSGLLYLCSENKLAITSLVQCLYLPAVSVCDTVLDTLFEVFRVKTARWFDDYLSGKRLTIFRRSKYSKRDQTDSFLATDNVGVKATLTDQYLGLILLIFVDAGLLEALVHVAEDTKHTALSRKAALLIGEILYLSNRILPLDFVSRLQALPRLFALASAFTEDLPRLAATTALQSVDSFTRNMARLHGHETSASKGGDTRKRNDSIEDSLQRGQRVLETTKVKSGLQIDDTTFRNLLVDSQVLTASKEEHKWSFEALMTLFEGPLVNPHRFDEVNRGSKFLPRLMAFFHPLQCRFSDLPRSAENQRWAGLLITIVETLMAQPEGVRFLLADKMFRQIADALIMLNPLTNAGSSEPFLSKKRLESTMSGAYLDLIGVMTRTQEGMDMLERFHVISGLYLVADLKNRDDVTRSLLESLDYSRDGHTRVWLSKLLTSGRPSIRLLSTRYIGQMLQTADRSSRDWIIRLLLTQLYDPVADICQLAIDSLDEACADLDNLATVLECRPSLDLLGERGAPLLFRFLANSVGVRHLYFIGYIDRELDDWYARRNAIYVRQVELQLARHVGLGNSRQRLLGGEEGAAPPHFYGELVKTLEGQEILRAKGHFAKFAAFLRKYGLEDERSVRISTLKSILWAVGNIGASSEGLSFLEEEDSVTEIVKIAQTSRCYSVRGTCFYVLGLLARSKRGAELLEEHGWVAAYTPLEDPIGICVPIDTKSFLCVPKITPRYAATQTEGPVWSTTHTEREAVAAMANLTNHLLTHKSSKTLARLRARHGHIYSSPELFCRALRLMEMLHYRLPARRFIFDLFTMPITPDNLDMVARARVKLDSEASVAEVMENGTLSAPVWKVGQTAADFSDEEEDAIDTVPRQELVPLSTARGFREDGAQGVVPEASR